MNDTTEMQRLCPSDQTCITEQSECSRSASMQVTNGKRYYRLFGGYLRDDITSLHSNLCYVYYTLLFTLYLTYFTGRTRWLLLATGLSSSIHCLWVYLYTCQPHDDIMNNPESISPVGNPFKAVALVDVNDPLSPQFSLQTEGVGSTKGTKSVRGFLKQKGSKLLSLFKTNKSGG